MRRRLAIAAAIVAVAAGVAGYGVVRARGASHYVAPLFVDPSPGPRAPRSDFLGVRVGVSRRADVDRVAAEWKLSCADRSMHTLMSEMRDRKRAEVQKAEAEGKPDAVSGASILTKRTARDENPQVRLNCDGASASLLHDRARPASEGRVLFVFDSKDAVVRHASFQRHHGAWSDALADFDDARLALTAAFGPGKDGASGAAPATATDPLPKYARRTTEWRFTDLVATVTLTNLGGRGFSLNESAEVPFPVRADAPSRR